jgi:sulfate-transporting ATPase
VRARAAALRPHWSVMPAQYIYTMRDLRRFYPPDREVLRGINLSFFPGAKIGVIGSNGSGKSSLLRIMAGIDDGFSGEARLTPGLHGRVPAPGAGPRSDQGRAGQRVGRRCGGDGARRPVQRGVCRRVGDPDADFDELLAEQAELQDKIDAAGAWDLERTLEIAMDALGCRPATSEVTTLSGGERRRVALCRLLLSKPDLSAARRADEPPRRGVGGLARAHAAGVPGTVVAVTHDRYFLDNVAGWILELDRGAGIPWEGNYSSWLEQKQARLAGRGEGRSLPAASAQRELEWIRMSPRARQAKGKARINAYNDLVAEAEAAERRADKLEITIPPGPRLGDQVVDAGAGEGFRRPAADRRDCRSSCLRAASSGSSVRTAPARRRCSG